MIDLIKYACSGFWTFCGVVIITAIVMQYIVNGLTIMWSRLMRCIMVSKHGWPPSHLDADGDPINNLTE